MGVAKPQARRAPKLTFRGLFTNEIVKSVLGLRLRLQSDVVCEIDVPLAAIQQPISN
jgi:hypothetical protein